MLEVYAGEHMLPARRMQMGLAHLTHLTAVAHGAKDSKVKNYLFDPPEQPPPSDPATIAAQALGFSPRFKKRRKAE